MNERDTLAPGLQALADLIGLPDLKLDESGMCTLQWNDDVLLSLIVPQGAGAVYFSVSLGPVPPGDREAFFERLLRKNFLLLDTDGATLALDDESREVHLTYALDLNHFSPETFPDLVGNLLQTAERVKSEVHAAGTPVPSLRSEGFIVG